MKIDSIYLIVFCGVQLFLFSSLGNRLFYWSLDSDNYIVWSIFCGIGFGIYPWLRTFLNTTPRLYFVSVCVHLLAILILSTAVSYAIVGATNHFAEWQTALLLMTVPAALAGFVVLLFSYAKFCFSRHA